MTHNYSFASLQKLFVTVVFFFIVATTGATTQTVNLSGTSFTPPSFSINLGDTVKWVWIDGIHTTTSTTIPLGAASWNHDINSATGNTEFIYVPTVIGIYNYQCNFHSVLGMTGSFSVVCGTPSVTISAGGPTTFCSSSSVVLSKSSAANYTSYQWKKNGVAISGQTTTSTTVNTTGSYTLVATNSCGNTGTSNPIGVTVNTAPTTAQAAISAGGPTTFCSGGNVVLTVATAGLTYQWKNGGVTISGATLQSFTASATGVYSCAVTNGCGTTTSNTILVVVNQAPTTAQAAISAGGPTTFCSGGNVVLTVATAGLTYQWKNGGSAISGATLQSFTASASGAYTCDVSNSCGTTGSNTITVTVNTAPTSGQAAISAGGATTFCSGGNVVLTVATSGLLYQWKNGGSAISGATLQSFTASATGSYTCDVSNTCGTTGSNTISVTVNTAPTNAEAAISAGGATTFCSGGNVVLTVATAGLTYQWKNGGSAISGETNQSFTASASGTYSCDVTNSCGTTGSNTISVTVNSAPTTAEATISAGGSTALCGGGSVVLTVATAGLIYQWNNSASPISGETNQSFTASSAGSYTCDVSNSCGTTTSNTIVVTADAAPTSAEAAITAGGATTFCSGGNVVLTVATAGLIYQWKNGGSAISGATNQSFTASSAGSYTCDVSNGCGTTTSNAIAVTVNVAPTSAEAAITAGGATTFCSGGNVVLTVATAGLTYQWKNGASAISGATLQSFTASSTGSYSCDASNSCGTTGSNSISVTVNPPPTSGQASISAGGAITFCSGGNVVLTVATAGLLYQWKNGGSAISGATNQSFTASSSGSYTCDVSNSCGTTASNTIVVTVNTAPTVAQATITANGPTSFCKGGNVVLTVATAGLTYQWRKGTKNLNGFTQQSYTSKATATYSCVVSNSCGTTISNSIATTSNPSPTATISQAPCSGHAVLLTCNANPSTGVTFQWKKGSMMLSGATNSTFSATMNATYKCTVTITATGCTKASAGSNVTITCRAGDEVPDNKLTVYPNPTSDYFNINTTQLDPQSVIYIYDLTGRLVESQQVNGGEMKIGQALSNGVYFLKIAENGETRQVIKLVKNF